MPGASSRRRPLLLPWLAGYQREWLRGDVTTGLLVVAIAIPLSMGMAEVAGVPPVTGLYTCVLPLLAYACVGASRHLVIGLDASTAVMLAAAVAPLARGDPGRYLAFAGALTLVVGAILVLAGGLRLGALARLLSNPGLLGYQAGLGVIVIVNQAHRLIGIPVSEPDPLPRAAQIVRRLGHLNGWTLGLGVGIISTVAILRHRWPKAPGALIAIAAGTIAVGAAGLADRGVDVVGDVPAGLPSIAIPDVTFRDVATLLTAAAGIALVTAADTIATARSFAVRNGYHLDTNRELIALGSANCVSGLSGGIIASASAARTAVAEASGGRTPLASAIAGSTLALVLVLFTDALEAVPVAALAAVVIVAVARIVDVPAIVRLARVRPTEAMIAVVTLAITVSVGTLEGILVAAGSAIADAGIRWATRRAAHPASTALPAADPATSLRLTGPLCYVNAERFARDVAEAADRLAPAGTVMIDARGITDIDATAADTLRQLDEQLERDGRSFSFADPPPDVASALGRYELSALVLDAESQPELPRPVQR